MAGRCQTVPLGEVVEIVMGQSPSGGTVSAEHGLGLLNGPTEFGPHHPIPVQFTTNARKCAQLGDLLFCVRGSTTGRMNWADQEYAIGRGIAAIRHRQEPALQPFVRGVIELELPGLLVQATGSTFPNVSAFQLAEIPYPCLDKNEQRAIAHILGTLDDKIELSRRMNQRLEEMSRALFKSWFVDFDPVHAKATLKHHAAILPQGGSDWSVERARAYLDRMDPDIAALFPDSLVDSQLGPIPEGWDVGCFGEVVEQMRGKESPLASPDAIFHHFSVPAFDDNQRPKAERGENIKSQKSRVLPGVVLLSKLNPEIERVWLVDVCATDRAVCSTEFLVLRPRPSYGTSFVYCFGRSPAFRQELGSLVTGTSKSHQRVQANAVFALPVVLFPKPISEAFERVVSVFLKMTQANLRESGSLAALRDSLLPKLVSGELRVGVSDDFDGDIVTSLNSLPKRHITCVGKGGNRS